MPMGISIEKATPLPGLTSNVELGVFPVFKLISTHKKITSINLPSQILTPTFENHLFKAHWRGSITASPLWHETSVSEPKLFSKYLLLLAASVIRTLLIVPFYFQFCVN